MPRRTFSLISARYSSLISSPTKMSSAAPSSETSISDEVLSVSVDASSLVYSGLSESSTVLHFSA